MRLRIETPVDASLEEVKNGFTEDLFLRLNPPFPPVKLLEFGGCEKGDRVALQLNFLLFKQNWISDITEDAFTTEKWHFVDIGSKLPFFLKSWRHQHEVYATETGSVIVDDITFSTGNLLADIFMYPALVGQFLYRKPIYRRIFKKSQLHSSLNDSTGSVAEA